MKKRSEPLVRSWMRLLNRPVARNLPWYGSQTPENSPRAPRRNLASAHSIERVETKQDDVKFVQKPIAPPTLGGWAARVGIARQTVWTWTENHAEFSEAANFARTIQEDILIRMGALGAYNAKFAEFMLKNLHEWTDRSEVKNTSDVHLHFDAEDEGSL